MEFLEFLLLFVAVTPVCCGDFDHLQTGKRKDCLVADLRQLVRDGFHVRGPCFNRHFGRSQSLIGRKEKESWH